MTRPNAEAVTQSLERIGIFAGLAPSSLARLQKRCAWRRYEPGETIVDHLDASNDVFFIVSGDARASLYSVSGKAVTFTDLGPGEMFGEIAAIDGGPRSARIEARTSCLVAAMPASVFREVLFAEPSVTQALLHQVVGRIRVLTTRIYEFSALAVSNRIQAEVLRLAMLAPREGNRARIDTAPTHAEIASRVSTHREAVTREFNRLSRLGVIEQQGRTLLVKDVERLGEMVHDATGE
jgi:CRP/FNR family transcriptional regulator, cyclic AMP receptor protein